MGWMLGLRIAPSEGGIGVLTDAWDKRVQRQDEGKTRVVDVRHCNNL